PRFRQKRSRPTYVFFQLSTVLGHIRISARRREICSAQVGLERFCRNLGRVFHFAITRGTDFLQRASRISGELVADGIELEADGLGLGEVTRAPTLRRRNCRGTGNATDCFLKKLPTSQHKFTPQQSSSDLKTHRSTQGQPATRIGASSLQTR